MAELALEKAGAAKAVHSEEPLDDGQLENARKLGAGIGGVFDKATPPMVDNLDESSDGDKEERIANL